MNKRLRQTYGCQPLTSVRSHHLIFLLQNLPVRGQRTKTNARTRKGWSCCIPGKEILLTQAFLESMPPRKDVTLISTTPFALLQNQLVEGVTCHDDANVVTALGVVCLQD